MFSSCSRRTKKRPSPSSLPTEARDWAALPSDALHEVFLKLDARDIVFCAEVVCKAWRRVVVEEPTLWRHVDMSVVPDECIDTAMRDAVDRRAGLLESFSGPWDDEFLLYIGARTPSLKSLHLSHYGPVWIRFSSSRLDYKLSEDFFASRFSLIIVQICKAAVRKSENKQSV